MLDAAQKDRIVKLVEHISSKLEKSGKKLWYKAFIGGALLKHLPNMCS